MPKNKKTTTGVSENKTPLITEKDVKRVKQECKDTAVNNITLTEKEQKLLEKCIAEAKLPISLKDKDFKLGEQELDIRGLCADNKDQLFFRLFCIMVGMLRSIADSVVDIERLQMLGLKKQGVNDLAGELDTLLNELTKERSKLFNDKKAENNKA